MLFLANRVVEVTRGPVGSAPTFFAFYTYFTNDLLESITYGNGTQVFYEYDLAQRVTQIEHREAGGLLLRLDYEYAANDLVSRITETNAVLVQTETVYNYDTRGRLTRELRSRSSIGKSRILVHNKNV